MLDTTGGARILRGADQAGHCPGHKMEVDVQSHRNQIVSINLVAFIKRFLGVLFGNASRRLWKTSRRKRCGALMKAYIPCYITCYRMLYRYKQDVYIKS